MTDPKPSIQGGMDSNPPEIEESKPNPETPVEAESPPAPSTQDTAEEEKSAPKEFTWGDGLSLDVSASQMSARLEIAVDCAEFYTAQDLFRFLRGNKVVYGVEESQLQEILDNKLFNEPIVVSKGKPPIHGDDGYVDWQVDLTVLDGAKLVEHRGRVDWKDQHHILQVEENELLGRLIPPTNGETGMNVYGQEIPAIPGKEAKFPAGKGVRIGENGDEMYAEIDGVVCRDGDKISVSPTYTVQGDIDLKTGNVSYKETVMVTGCVLSDFKIHAGQDIHVNGLVEGAFLDADGNIYINGGIQGDQKARIRAGGDVTVKFINNATVEAGGNVVVTGAISNSVVKAGKRVLVEGAKAVIVGGEIQAEQEITASILGSDLGVKTRLQLGAELQKKIDNKNDQAQKINALLANYKKLQQAANTLNQLRDKGKLNPDQTELRLKIIRGGLQMQAQIKRMQEEQELIKEEIERARKEMVGVVAKQVAWPGVQITILGQQFAVKTQTSKAIFALLKNEVNVFAFKEQEEKKGKKDKEKGAKEQPGEGDGVADEDKKTAVADALAKVREDAPIPAEELEKPD